MNPDQRDALRAAAYKQHACPKCGGRMTELTPEQVARRDDTFPELRYRECSSCGTLQTVKARKRA